MIIIAGTIDFATPPVERGAPRRPCRSRNRPEPTSPAASAIPSPPTRDHPLGCRSSSCGRTRRRWPRTSSIPTSSPWARCCAARSLRSLRGQVPQRPQRARQGRRRPLPTRLLHGLTVAGDSDGAGHGAFAPSSSTSAGRHLAVTGKVEALASRRDMGLSALLARAAGPMGVSTSDHPWHQPERGELAVADCRTVSLLRREHGSSSRATRWSTCSTWSTVQRAGPRAHRRTRDEGYRTALLTNSVHEFRPTLESQVDMSLFDVVVDSSAEGCRKPEPAIYERTTEKRCVTRADRIPR